MISGRIVTMLCAAALAASLASQAQTNVYRWVDKDGKVHFSDTPPPPDVKESSQKRMGGGDVAAPQVPYATQEAARKNPVILYTSTSCGELCDQGRALLAKRGVPYSERNAQTNPADAEELKKLIGKLDVPVLRVGEAHVKGYAEGLWQEALDTAGYARSALPGQNVAPAPNPPVAAPNPPVAASNPPAPAPSPPAR